MDGAAVEVRRRDDVVAGLDERENRERGGGLSGGDAERRGAAFEGREPLLERIDRRVCRPASRCRRSARN